MYLLPAEFSPQAQARIEVEIIGARREYRAITGESVTQGSVQRKPGQLWSNEEQALHKSILRGFLAFAREACALFQDGHWPPDQVRQECLNFLRDLTADAYAEHDNGNFRRVIQSSGDLEPELIHEFHLSAEWVAYENEILAVAECVAKLQIADGGSQSEKDLAGEQRTDLAESPTVGRKRGRPQSLPNEQKAKAQAVKDSGGSNRDAAAVLYRTRRPSDQQVKNIPSILRHHRKKISKARSVDSACPEALQK